MPTYDYECKSCGHSFELFQSMSDAVKRKCPECGKAALERLIGTGAAIIFKGSGFYQTDYRTDSYKKSADADKPADASKPADGKAPETKAESKSDARSPNGKAADARASEPKADTKADRSADRKAETKAAGASSAASKPPEPRAPKPRPPSKR